MFILFILSIIAGFVLFFITKKKLGANNITIETQKTYKNVNLIGFLILLVLFAMNLFTLISNLILYGTSILFYIINGFRYVIVYLLGIVSAILYIKSIKNICSIKTIVPEISKSNINSQKEIESTLYYTSFKVLKTVFCILTTITAFLIYGFIDEWDFGIETIIILLIGSFIFSLIYTAIYFLPYKIAAKKKHRQTRAIYILNIFAGWTIIIWLIALVWANTEPKETIVVNQNSQSIQSDSEEILNFKKLLDDGIITQEEFEVKKKQILGL